MKRPSELILSVLTLILASAAALTWQLLGAVGPARPASLRRGHHAPA